MKTIGGDTLLHTAVDHRRAVDYRNHAVIGIGITAADAECHHITIGDAARGVGLVDDALAEIKRWRGVSPSKQVVENPKSETILRPCRPARKTQAGHNKD